MSRKYMEEKKAKKAAFSRTNKRRGTKGKLARQEALVGYYKRYRNGRNMNNPAYLDHLAQLRADDMF
jgi:hypothetical protein